MADQAEKLRELVDRKRRLEQSTKKPAQVKTMSETQKIARADSDHRLDSTLESDSPSMSIPELSDRSSNPATPARVLAVTSGKGGVGKSNLSVNLGLALSRLDLRVVVVDMDLGLANVNVIANVRPNYNLFDVLKGRREMHQIVESGPGNISIVAGASGEDELANLTRFEAERFLRQLEQLEMMTDVLILDTGAGISRNVLQFVCSADRTILVTTPEPTAITDAYGLVKAAVRKQGKPRFDLVVNRSTSLLEGKKVAEKMQQVSNEFLNVPLNILGYMVEDEAVPKAVRNRQPFLLDYPSARVSRCVHHLATRITDPETGVKPGGIEGFFSRMFNWIST